LGARDHARVCAIRLTYPKSRFVGLSRRNGLLPSRLDAIAIFWMNRLQELKP
jgi:hypothetical protein